MLPRLCWRCDAVLRQDIIAIAIKTITVTFQGARRTTGKADEAVILCQYNEIAVRRAEMAREGPPPAAAGSREQLNVQVEAPQDKAVGL